MRKEEYPTAISSRVLNNVVAAATALGPTSQDFIIAASAASGMSRITANAVARPLSG